MDKEIGQDGLLVGGGIVSAAGENVQVEVSGKIERRGRQRNGGLPWCKLGARALKTEMGDGVGEKKEDGVVGGSLEGFAKTEKVGSNVIPLPSGLRFIISFHTIIGGFNVLPDGLPDVSADMPCKLAPEVKEFDGFGPLDGFRLRFPSQMRDHVADGSLFELRPVHRLPSDRIHRVVSTGIKEEGVFVGEIEIKGW